MKRKIISMLLSLLLMAWLCPSTVLASADWPDNVSIESDAGIIMDANSGAVIYGKNIHATYAPASITKVLTALIVLERCSMDETVTFSQNAVYNVESNSSSAGYDTGDTASVKDCLYALLLKSANEAANALAEHISGTTEEFAVLMNEKAAELGCQDSHFSNPSGLNDENHYVSAYDMALITKAAFENADFSKIVATTYYELPPNKKNPEGQGISPGNKMIKKNWPDQYRPDVIGGKTGYTSIALNTLVIGAQQGETKFVTVILHSSGTQYSDTKALLNFGFNNFKAVRIADYDKTFSTIGDDLKISGLPTSEKQVLTIDPDSKIILPVTADFSETTVSLDYTLPAGAPSGAIACVNYLLGERTVGHAYLTLRMLSPMPVWLCPRRSLKCSRLRWLPLLKIRIFHIRRTRNRPQDRQRETRMEQHSRPNRSRQNRTAINSVFPSKYRRCSGRFSPSSLLPAVPGHLPYWSSNGAGRRKRRLYWSGAGAEPSG